MSVLAVEFIGGPLDGEKRMVASMYYRAPIFEPIDMMAPDALPAPKSPRVREHRYRLARWRDQDVMVYEGVFSG